MGAVYEDYLAHHGIKGQKWGLRRFQNEDGSYTQEGRERYGRNRPESSTWKSSDVGALSDAELRRRLTRLNQEQQYKNLTMTRGDKVKKFLVESGKTILVATAVSMLAGGVKARYKKVFDATIFTPVDKVSEYLKTRIGKAPGLLIAPGV